jgi:hypothetical protein
MKLVTLIITICYFPISAHGQISDVETLLHDYDESGSQSGKHHIIAQLASMQQGMALINLEVGHRKEARFYCAPPKLAVTGEQILNMLRRQVKEDPHLAKYPVSIVMLETLEKAFPCNK